MGEHHKGIFKQWIHSQVDSWLHEFESWDMMLEDGDVTEDEIEYIQENLSVTDITISDKTENN